MPLWKLVPMAHVDDPLWLDHPIWNEVVVRASTAARARLLAAEMERREISDGVPSGNESLSFRSGFEDEKLYAARRVDAADVVELEAEGPDEVVRATRA